MTRTNLKEKKFGVFLCYDEDHESALYTVKKGALEVATSFEVYSSADHGLFFSSWNEMQRKRGEVSLAQEGDGTRNR